MSALWDDLGALKVLDDFAASAEASLSPRPRTFVRRMLVGAVAASVAVAFIVGVTQYAHFSSGQIHTEELATAIGEQRKVHFSDGSAIFLNTNSRVAVDYTRRERKVTLVQGEAHFDVAKSRRRPYLVYAGDGLVRAVGTAFTVRLRSGAAVEVTVEEGRVALSTGLVAQERAEESTEDVPPRELGAGANAFFDGTVERVTLLPPAEVSRKLAWRQGILAYAGEPLAEVVADIGRYTDITIEISDPELRSRQIGGYFKVGEVEEMFESLELNFGLSIERVSDGHVRITANS